MKILIVNESVPYPLNSGSQIRIYNLLRCLSREHEVSLVTLYNPATGEDRGADTLKTICARVELVPQRKHTRREYWTRVLQGEPRYNAFLYFPEMAERIRAMTAREPFDIVDVQNLGLASYVHALPSPSTCRRILTFHDVNYVQLERVLAVTTHPYARLWLLFDRLVLKRAMLRYARQFDRCIMVSEKDRDLFKRDGPDLDLAVVSNGVDTEAYSLLPNQSVTPTVLFVGAMNYGPNADAALFFCREIWPLVKQQSPARLLLVGRKPPEAIQALASDDVSVPGEVDSVIPYYQQAQVSVVPLRAGSGTRLKILESMALGRPVVSTTLGCEGLAVTHGENILIADSPADFAAQTVRLLNHADLRRRLIANARQLVETRYDWHVISQELAQVYSQTLG